MLNNKRKIINISKELICDKKIINDEDNDINKLNKNNFDINMKVNDNYNLQTELSTIKVSNLNSNEYKDISSNKEMLLEQTQIKVDQQKKNLLLYGNNINDLTPKHLGKLFAFFYINQKPLIIIGPDCKKIVFFNIFYF